MKNILAYPLLLHEVFYRPRQIIPIHPHRVGRMTLRSASRNKKKFIVFYATQYDFSKLRFFVTTQKKHTMIIVNVHLFPKTSNPLFLLHFFCGQTYEHTCRYIASA
jgi:hypothetical protein